MAGQASGGQQLTPNRNVNAPAGFGGDLWGAYGGGITPVGGGVTGDQGWDAPIAKTLSDGETATNFELNPVPLSSAGAPTQSVKSQVSDGALSERSFDDALPTGGSNAG
jgi:hypothetical protein